ncbi:unnamed protein product, partial [Prorocentrum cordatum]
ESNAPLSKIDAWVRSRVIWALRCLASGRVNAERLAVWAIALKDFGPQIICGALAATRPAGKPTASNSLAISMPMLETDALGGDAGEGAPEPSIVTAQHFDSFRGEAAERAPPAELGDGGLRRQGAPALEALLNPSEEGPASRARRGPGAFATGAPRKAAINSCDDASEDQS